MNIDKNMKKLIILICMFSIICGCSESIHRSISIQFENNSDLDTVLTINTYLNGRDVKTTRVRRDSLKINDASENIIVNESADKKMEFRFIIQSTHDTASCFVSPQQIGKLKYIHVNFVTTVFEKGFVIFDRVLDKDSVVHHEFYCEPIDKNGVKM
jgi:hypothetical protein